MSRFFDRLRGTNVPPVEQFPDEWAEFLWTHYAHYRRLPSRLRSTFEQGARQFIAAQRITGVEVDVDDRLRVLVASSAATLSLAWHAVLSLYFDQDPAAWESDYRQQTSDG